VSRQLARNPAARWAAALAWLAATTLFGACEPADRGPTSRRHVLLITVDTLRADHVSALLADGEQAMPFVNSLLARGLSFANATTPVARTTQALASLLTGRYPQGHGVRLLFDRLPEGVPYLPELARTAGYTTIATVTNHILSPDRGLQRGFDRYDFAPQTRDASASTAAALRALDSHETEDALFVWVHYNDPHVPYYPPVKYARTFDPGYEGRYALHFGDLRGGIGEVAYPGDLGKVRAVYRNDLPDRVNEHVRMLYAAEIRHTDDAIRDLVTALEDRFGRDWVIFFAADHGEELGEHGYYYDHGDTVYQPSLHVPLGIVVPASDPLHRIGVVQERVSVLDVAPTLIELLALGERVADRDGGDSSAHPFHGRSLVPSLKGETLPPRTVFAETGLSFYPEQVHHRLRFDLAGRIRAAIGPRYKLIFVPGELEGGTYELYDLSTDPDERRDLYHPDHIAAAPLRADLEAWMAEDVARSPSEPSQQDLEALRSLGYAE